MDIRLTEQKLNLLHQIRKRYSENETDMYNREKILYGENSPRFKKELSYFEDNQMNNSTNSSSLKVRFVLACILISIVLFMDKYDKKIAGITSDIIFEAISADYENDIETILEQQISDLPTQL